MLCAVFTGGPCPAAYRTAVKEHARSFVAAKCRRVAKSDTKGLRFWPSSRVRPDSLVN